MVSHEEVVHSQERDKGGPAPSHQAHARDVISLCLAFAPGSVPGDSTALLPTTTMSLAFAKQAYSAFNREKPHVRTIASIVTINRPTHPLL